VTVEVLGYIVAVAVAMGLLGLWVAAQKRRSPAEGCILGLCFGPLGVLIEALLPSGVATANEGGSRIKQRSLDEKGQVAYIENRYREVLEETDPFGQLPYRRKLTLIKSVDRRLMQELKLTPTQFLDFAAEAKRNVLRIR
jgi:hypothetical protein